MIQTTIFNYFNCNGSIKQSVNRTQSYKQTSLTNYFNIVPKKKIKLVRPKKNTILNYFKPKEEKEKEEEEEEEKKGFDLVLVDISTWKLGYIKKNMYDIDLKYIAISYRWGELNEQQVRTPDYTAHITSFDLNDLEELCAYIKDEPDLKNISYLWIDAISVDQHNHARKKDTILKMNQIYNNATYILAIPDLHLKYLMKNTANIEVIKLIKQYTETIYKEIHYYQQQQRQEQEQEHQQEQEKQKQRDQEVQEHKYHRYRQYSFIKKIKNMIKRNEDTRKNENIKLSGDIKISDDIKIDQDAKISDVIKIDQDAKISDDIKIEEDTKRIKDMKKAYSFLAYLMDDWSNRAWVISEYHIAKEKYIKHGTPLKYMFISLLRKYDDPFFSYSFGDDDDDDQQQYIIDNEKIIYKGVDNPKTFNRFVKERFMQRSHLNMILNSYASRNEDRFHAVLPSWDKYKHVIKNRNSVSGWNITDMTSVRLKLYEIMNDGDDLWDKATLLYACSKYDDEIILPSFASHYDYFYLELIEKDNTKYAYKYYEYSLLEYIENNEEEKERIKQLINEYKMNSKPLWTENLTSIQFNHHYLSIKSNIYFIMEIGRWRKSDYLSAHPLLTVHDFDPTHLVYIPFFTFTIPDYINYPPYYGSSIYLLGNIDKNRWVLFHDNKSFNSNDFCSKDYNFNIY